MDAGGPVGRAEVAAQLRRAVDDAVTGQGRLILLAGEPGIGKTTQLGAAARHAAGRGVRTAWGWGSPADGAPAYWPWTQVLRELELDALPDAEDRFALFDAVASALLAESRVQPILVLFDDLQWADVASLLLLDFLARRLPSGALTVLGAYRDTGGVPDALAALAGRSTVIPLGGLPPDAVALVATAILGAPPPPELVARLHRRTGGNPFFVQQVAWLVKAGDDGVPPGVREALDQRFGHLDTTCAEALSAAAIAGRPFTVGLLAAVTGLASGAVADIMADGVRGKVLVDGGAGFRFAHDLFREYAEDRLTASGRAALHGRLGLALEAERERGGDVSVAELATHFAHAGTDAERTLRYATAAAGEALRQLAFEEAVRHWERALDAVGPDLARRRDVLHELAATRWRAGDGPGAAHAYTLLADLARRGGDGPALARAALGLQAIGSPTMQPADRLADLLTEALAGLAAADPLRSAVLAALARVLAWSGRDPTRAISLADEAVRTARSLGAGLPEALLARHNVAWGPAGAPTRLAVARELVDVADPDRLVEARLLLAGDLLEVGDPAYRAELDAFIGLAEASGQPRWRYAAVVRRAALELLAGRYADAEPLIEQAAALGAECGEPGARDVWHSQRWDLYEAQGRPLLDGDGGPGARALELAAAGRRDEAAELVRPLLDEEVPDHQRWTLDLVLGTHLLTLLRDPELADRLYRKYLPLAAQTVVDGALVAFKGAVAHYLGVLAGLRGDPDTARAHLAAAVELHDRLGARAWALRSRFELARLTGADTVPLVHEAGVLGLTALARAGGTFRHDGPQWTLSYQGVAVTLRDAKGLADLAALLSVPDRPIAAVDLAGRGAYQLKSDNVLDETARRQLKARIGDLDEEIEEAERWFDPERAERARAERDAIVAEVARAVGLGGRARRLGDESERARKAVTARIRDAIGRIEQVHPQLGAHLRASVTTGTYCVYSPASPTSWQI